MKSGLSINRKEPKLNRATQPLILSSEQHVRRWQGQPSTPETQFPGDGPSVLLLRDHKVCSQLALIVDLRAIARIARVDSMGVHVRNQGEGSFLELFTGVLTS